MPHSDNTACVLLELLFGGSRGSRADVPSLVEMSSPLEAVVLILTCGCDFTYPVWVGYSQTPYPGNSRFALISLEQPHLVVATQ
jgi:hypothetical protein